MENFDIDFLLGRNTLDASISLGESVNMQDRIILVTGAGGSIGAELCRQILYCQPKALILFDISEFGLFEIYNKLKELAQFYALKTLLTPVIGTIQSQELLFHVMKSYAVEVVYHTAAYKHVSLLEANIVEATLNNIFGTYSTVRAALDSGVESFVLVSTDKAVRPASIMGATKRFSELIVRSFAYDLPYLDKVTRFCIVRFGNVLGSSGSVMPIFLKQIANGKPLTISHPKVERYFMTPLEAAHLVIQAELMKVNGGIFFFDMGKPVKIVDLAKRLVSITSSDKGSLNNIEMEYIGLRLGEKLREDLYDGGFCSTENKYIFRVTEEYINFDALMSILDDLKKACNDFDEIRIVNIFEKSRILFTRRL